MSRRAANSCALPLGLINMIIIDLFFLKCEDQ
jgi:hypothetical protein